MSHNQQLIENCREILAETENHERWAVDMARAALAHLEGNQGTRIPPPITEEEGYRLNTSWHAGAIFRDGANWMRDEVLRLGAGVPDGWKLVPLEPTPEMLSQIDLTSGWTERALSVRYKALLDAAPEVKS